ncbi:hypothetical protein H9P43_007717 [Blastocladiella emersonii ATCC 22665]|nr:hypothetical protein H9P43_007717 [Blastocladiella emersonii ATCC 22665]
MSAPNPIRTLSQPQLHQQQQHAAIRIPSPDLPSAAAGSSSISIRTTDSSPVSTCSTAEDVGPLSPSAAGVSEHEQQSTRLYGGHHGATANNSSTHLAPASPTGGSGAATLQRKPSNGGTAGSGGAAPATSAPVMRAVEDDVISGLDEVEAEFIRMQAYGNVRGWRLRVCLRVVTGTLGYLVCGTLVTAGPGVAGILIHRPAADPWVLDVGSTKVTLATELIRWSAWATILWWALMASFTTVRLVRRMELDQSRLHNSLRAFEYYACVAVCMVLSVILFTFIFPTSTHVVAETYHGVALNTVASAAVIAIVLFIQKLCLYLTAWSYYQTAYREKEKRKVFALTTLHWLEVAVPPSLDLAAESDSTMWDSVRITPNKSKKNARFRPSILKEGRGSLELGRSGSPIQRPDSPAVPDGIWVLPDGNTVRTGPTAAAADSGTPRDSMDVPRASTVGPQPRPSIDLMRQHTVKTYPRRPRGSSAPMHRLSTASASEIHGAAPPSPPPVPTKADSEAKYSPEEAKKRAKHIYHRLTRSSRRNRVLTLDHFLPYYEGDDAAAREAFNLFDIDNNGDTTYAELVDAVQAIYSDCADLAKARALLAVVLAKLDRAFWVFSVLCSAVLICVVWGMDLGRVLVPLGSFLVALSFAFGSTVRSMFESVVFVFSTHAYDVGDRVFVDGMNLVVREIGILSTTFERWDGHLIYQSNVELQRKTIVNVRRSPPMTEPIEVQVAFDTSAAKIAALEDRLNAFLRTHRRDYRDAPGLFVQVFEIENVNRVKLVIFLDHRSNWQDARKRWQRRSKFVAALKDAMALLDIKYSLPPARHEIYDATDRTELPAAMITRAQFGQELIHRPVAQRAM